MSNLVIDIGNSYCKTAIFQKRELLHFERKEQIDYSEFDFLIERFDIKKGVISSVAGQTEPLSGYLASHIEILNFSTTYNPGIKNEYQSVSTLGLDRWAKVVAAFKLYHKQNLLLIDAGTCITYDVLNAESVYKGGSISLGINMRFKALNDYTGRLPLVFFDKNEDFVPEGNNTENALKNGVLRGVLNEIEGFMQIENNRNTSLKIVLTGGDADFLSKQLKSSIFANQIIIEPYLVLRGLNEIIVSQICIKS